MSTSQHHLVRTKNISELKSQMEKKIGRAKTENYLIILSNFLSLRIEKSDFDKLIVAIVKKENISLHNALLKGILKNVSFSKIISFKSLCEDLPKSPRKRRTQRRLKDCNGSKGKSQITIEEDNGEEEEEVDQMKSQRIEAPFGVRDVIKRRRRRRRFVTSSELLDSVSLKKKLEEEDGLRLEGFEVSVEFVNLLNAGLDVFLKRLIKPCLEFAALRSSSSSSQGEECSSSASSMVDFQVAMELNRLISRGRLVCEDSV